MHKNKQLLSKSLSGIRDNLTKVLNKDGRWFFEISLISLRIFLNQHRLREMTKVLVLFNTILRQILMGQAMMQANKT